MASRVILATCSLAERWMKTLDPDNGHYPLGIAYLHAALEEVGHEVEMQFLNHVPYETCLSTIMERIVDFKPNVLGLSIISDSRVSSFRIIEAVHQRYPDIHIVLGGVHVTTLKEQIARRFPYCTLCLGESEITLRELIEVFEKRGERAQVNGLAYFEDDEVRITPERALIADLDALPFARHEAFFNERRVTAEILTSRGCTLACTSWVLDTPSRRKIRHRSAPDVVDEIEYILMTYPQVSTMRILDDQFFADNRRVIELCDEIARRNVQCSFACSGRMKPLSKEVVFAMERANFQSVYLALETGSPSVLEKTRKDITVEDAIRAFELFRHSPINISVLMIVGLPGESLATVLESGALLQKLQKIKYHTYAHRVSTLLVYPGTHIYDLCLEAGFMGDDFWLTDGDVPNYTVEHSLHELAVFEEILLTYVSPVRLMTPGGLAVQKHMLPDIIRYALTTQELAPIVNLVLKATEELLAEEMITFTIDPDWAEAMKSDGYVHLSTVTREYGSDGRYQVNFTKLAANDAVRSIVRFAYFNRIGDLTDKITERCVKILEQQFKQRDDPDGVLDQLGMNEEWALATTNRIGLRL